MRVRYVTTNTFSSQLIKWVCFFKYYIECTGYFIEKKDLIPSFYLGQYGLNSIFYGKDNFVKKKK